MKILTEKEKKIMKVLWNAEEELPMTKILAGLDADYTPHFNTLSTLVKRLEMNGLVKHKVQKRRYFLYSAAVTQDEYDLFTRTVSIDRYFNGKAVNAISFMVEKGLISADDLRALADSL
jgi:predicted transcriptional regulator